MAWLAKTSAGVEMIFQNKPSKYSYEWSWSGGTVWAWTDGDPELGGEYDSAISLPAGSIKKLIGKDLTWKDDPVELI